MHPHRMLGLDALRAAAIVAVMVGHADSLWPGWPFSHLLSTSAVGAFFALSGFLVGGIALRDVRAVGDLPRFWLRRWLRTLPAALVVAVVAACIMRPGVADFLGVVTFTGFMLQVEDSYLTPYWSLAVEEWAYLLLPLLVLAVRRRDPLPWLAAVWVALIVWRTVAIAALPLSPASWIYATSLRLDAILVGVIAAAIAPRLTRTPRRWLAATGGIAASVAAFSPALSEWQASIVPALFAMTLPALAAWGGRLPAFASAAVQHVAALSYGLYLVHVPIYLGAVSLLAGAAPVVILLAAVAASWMLALLLRRYVELPFLALRDRLPAFRPAARTARATAPAHGGAA